MVARQDWFAVRRALPRVNAAEAILADIQEGIREGSLGVGSRLPSETSLAEHYGVSRPVVREALRSAQALGLTRTRSGSGTYVVSDTLRPPQRFGNYTTRDLMEARPAIEVPAAGLAAARRSEEQAAELLDICVSMEHEFQAQAWVRLDSLFHARIAAASGNAVFSSVVADTREALSQQSEIINLVAHRREPSNVEHREIAEAILAEDPDRASRAMQAHLDYVEAVVRPLIEGE
ncbi:FadR/GntR family transcriptional regulator [Leucobacter ruminantium]|uniref:FadR family transcriptional regulator n=1 Tax=Leucobacter ruminantium TaxID=1289170 RepID=A0A939RXG3_9MICO|nr:FadR/GntR family transcriptional regulator [Leucobacter ruminantium]MBO1803856.1 FadR family transcriptional regulator [Leucobacter ruminantium]